MTVHKSWQEFMEHGNSELQDTILQFSSMEKGKLFYRGEFKGSVVRCEILEDYFGAYTFDYEESISSLSQSCIVRLTIDDKLIININ